jgi:hypothetical protein
MSTLSRILAPARYLRRRLCERSTWMSIGVGVPIAAALTAPWSFVAIGVAIIGALTPEPPKAGDA